MFGFMIFCVFAFLAFIIISYCEVFYYVVQLIKDAFFMVLESIDIKRKKNSQIRREIQNNNVNSNNAVIITSIAKRKVEAMRKKYPYADEELFNNFLIQYNSAPMYSIEKMEYDIMRSHYKNELSNSNNIPKLHISDILAAKSFDTVYAFPISMKFYKIGCDYALLIEDDRIHKYVAYQSRSHYNLLQLCNEVYETVSIKKSNNIQITLEELFDENKYNKLIKIS